MSTRDHAHIEEGPREHAPRAHVARSKRLRWTFAIVMAPAMAALLGWVLSRSHAVGRPDDSGRGGGNDAPILDGDLIRFSDAFRQRAGVSTAPVEEYTLSPFVTVVGTLAHDPRCFAAVGARIHGRVRRVFKFDGDAVKAGTVLAEIESAELGRAEAQVLASRAKEKATEAEMKREHYLAEAKVTPLRDAEFAQASFDAARAERVAAERAVEALGGDMSPRTGVLVLRSPIAGHVVSSTAAIGRTVDPTATLFEVAELSSLWVQLRVFERELAGIHVGNAVEIGSHGLATHIAGKVDHVGEIIDVDTRTAPVRVVLQNHDGSLRPGQSVTARIDLDAEAGKRLTIPRAALTRIDGKPTVFVLSDRNTVEPRGVELGPEDAQRVAVESGVGAGEQVVVGGMFALKSEIFR